MARPKRQAFTSHLAEFRNRAQLTQEAVAERLSVSTESVRRHERGISTPGCDLQRAYSELYGATGLQLGFTWSATKLEITAQAQVSVDDLSRSIAPTRAGTSQLDARFTTGNLAQDRFGYSGTEDALAGEGVEALDGPPGKARLVPTTRRQIIRSVLGGAALTMLSAGRAAPLLANFGDSKPIEVFKAAHQMLIAEDNLFGPRHVIPRVEDQIAQMESVLASGTVSGSDAQELRFLQATSSEFCGWLYQDYGDHAGAQEWLNVALNRAYLANDNGLTCFIMARHSQLAGDMGAPQLAIESALAAINRAPDERLAAIAHTYAAHGYALQANAGQCERSYARAESLNARWQGESPWGVWLDDAYISVHRARSLATLGQFDRSVREHQTAINTLPATFRRDKGVYLARQAIAHAGNHDTEAAARTGTEALAIAVETQSGRIASDLAQVAQVMRTDGSVHAEEFIDAFRQTLTT